MKKLFLLLVIFFLLTNFSSAIKISPTQTTIRTEQYETKCVSIWVLPHEDFEITSRWSLEGKGDLTKYTLSAKKIGVNITYQYISDGEYEFCFTPKWGGNFSGIIYFYSPNSMTEIGSWVEIRANGQGPAKTISLMTGRVIEVVRDNNFDLWFVFLLLLIILLILILKSFIKRN